MKYLFFLMLIIFTLLLFLPVKFRVKYEYKKNKNHLSISSSYLFGIFSPEIYPFDKKHKKKKSNFKGFIALKNIIKELQYRGLIKYIWSRLSLEKIEFKTTIGTEDAFITSISYGILWNIIGISIAYLLMDKDIETLDIDVIPLFNKNYLDIRFDCIIKIRMVYIINIWIKFIKLYKGGGKSVRTSNRRVNEIYNE